jgi:hypothetical protein
MPESKDQELAEINVQASSRHVNMEIEAWSTIEIRSTLKKQSDPPLGYAWQRLHVNLRKTSNYKLPKVDKESFKRL